MYKSIATAVLGLALLGMVPAAPAGHGCNGIITEIIVEDGSAAGQGLYIDDRSGGAVTINHWIYLENNLIDGLQSGGSTGIPGGTDSCSHPTPDLVLF